MQKPLTAQNGRGRASLSGFDDQALLNIQVFNVRKHQSNTLCGFFDALVGGWRLKINGLSLHHRDGRWWVSLPGRPKVGRDGTQISDRAGNRQFQPVLEFASRADQDRFGDVVVAALRSFQQDLFLDEQGLTEPSEVTGSEQRASDVAPTGHRATKRRRRLDRSPRLVP